MSSDERESFEVTDFDLETEFNPNRFRRKLTKKQQIYGVFAPDDSDEDEQGPSSSRAGGRGRGPRMSYTSGQAFVSAGILDPSKKGDENANKDDEEPEDSIPVTDSSSEEEVQFVSFNQKQKSFNSMGLEIAGMRKKSLGAGAKGFEMYGIGAKLLTGMGFQPGKGLGKDLQGISAPIEAVVRKGRGAIGAYGKERKTAPAEDLDRPFKKAEAASTKEVKWHKTTQSKKEKVEYKYITAEEVLQQKQLRVRPDAGHLAKVKVIDLTGPEQRILSGYHAISGQQKPIEDWVEDKKDADQKFSIAGKPAFDVPELIHNVGLLSDACEQDILKNDKKAKYALDRKVALTEEINSLKQTVDQQRDAVIKMEKIMSDMQSICQSNLDLETAYIVLGKLKKDYEEEWELYQLHALVPAVAIPLIKEYMKCWSPLENPGLPLQLLNDWAVLLGSQTEQYDIILWETWMPCVRQANTAWNVKISDPMTKLVAYWKDVIPQWLLDVVYDQLILPKLSQAVEDWDPLSDVIPIHSWVHPWLPFLGTKLELIYPPIRSKLSNALIRWHPSDVSAKQILSPWLSVFSKGAMDTFLLKNIVPKLQLAMQELVINPLHQILDPWNWVMEWTDIVPISSIVNILESFFFPKWLQFLATWLNQFPHFEDVRQWYLWWRGMFKEALIKDPTITENLQKGLEMIGAAVQCPGQPIDFSYIISRKGMGQVTKPPPPSGAGPPDTMIDAIRMTSQVPHGFKELVQMKCEELGLIFMPVPNRYYEGKQIYKCGNVLIYISGNVVFIQRDHRMWIPASLQQLLQAATS